MKTKTKILLLLIVGCLGVFLDDLSGRLVKVERRQKEISRISQNVDELRSQVRAFPKLQRELVDQGPWGNQVRMITKETYFPSAAVQELPDLFKLSQRFNHVKIFRTAPRDPLWDTTISSYPSHQDQERGANEVLYIGSAGKEHVARVLIKFLDFKKEYFTNKKMLAAVIYLKQIANDPNAKDHLSWAGVINLFGVKKSWNPGGRGAGEVDKGSVCWLYARAQEEDWFKPGCSDPIHDFDPMILATSGPVVIGQSSDWIPIVFTDEGILRLQRWVAGKDELNFGFLLKAENETLEQALSAFHSGNSRVSELRPYLEIYYTEK